MEQQINPSKKYYEYLKSKGVDTPPTYESFEATLQDRAKAEKYYNYLKTKKVDAPPSFDSFYNTLSAKGASPESAAGSGDGSNAPQEPLLPSGLSLEQQRQAVGSHFDKLVEAGITPNAPKERKLSFVPKGQEGDIPFDVVKKAIKQPELAAMPVMEEPVYAGEKGKGLEAAKKQVKKNNEYNSLKQVANDFDKGLKRHEDIDIQAITKEFDDAYKSFEATGEGGDIVKEKERNLNEALSVLDKDYLSINATSQPFRFLEQTNKYDEIKGKMERGEKLSDAQEEFMYDTRKNSLAALYAKERSKIMEIEDAVDLATFNKEMAILQNETDQQKYNEGLADLTRRTGVTPAVLNELKSLYDKTAAVGESEKITDAKFSSIATEAGLDKMRSEQRKDSNVFSEAIRGLVGSMGTATLKLAELPKTLGAGQPTKYDFTDKLYDSVESIVRGSQGTWGAVEDAPDYLKYAYGLGSGVGSVAMFAAGGGGAGLAKIPQFIGTAGTAFLMSQPDNYTEAINAGMDDTEARIFSNIISAVEGSSEGIIPDSKYLTQTLSKTIISEWKRGVGIKEAFKFAMKQLPESISGTTAMAVKEGSEGLFTETVGDITKESMNAVSGRDYFQDTFDVDGYKEAFLTEAMTGGFMRFFQSTDKKSTDTVQAMRDAVDGRTAIVSNIEKSNPELAKEVGEVLDRAAEAKTGLESHSKWDKLTTAAQNKALDIVWQMELAEDARKRVSKFGIEDSEGNKKVESLTKELNDIFANDENTKAYKDATLLQLQEQRAKLGVEYDPMEGAPQNAGTTFERVERGLPTDPVAVSELSDWLYGKYKELSDMKKDDGRPLTIGQIESLQEKIGEDIGKLEDYRNESNIPSSKTADQQFVDREIDKRKPKEEAPAQEVVTETVANEGVSEGVTDGVTKEVDTQTGTEVSEVEEITPDGVLADDAAQEPRSQTEPVQETGTEVEGEQAGVGLGGDKPTFENVPIFARTPEEIETAKNEVFDNLNKLEVGSVIENSDGEIKVVTEKSTDKKGNQLIGVVTYIRQEDGSLRQMSTQVWASKGADGKIKLDYNPHSTGTNSKGERVTVTDQITDKKIDLSKENIFTEDENGNLIQINKGEQSIKETSKAGSVGVGGDNSALKEIGVEIKKDGTSEGFYQVYKDGKFVGLLGATSFEQARNKGQYFDEGLMSDILTRMGIEHSKAERNIQGENEFLTIRIKNSKAVEQSLKETPQAETPTPTQESNVPVSENAALKDVESTTKALENIELPKNFVSQDKGGILNRENYYRLAQEKFQESKGLSTDEIFDKNKQKEQFKTEKGRLSFQKEFEQFSENNQTKKQIISEAYHKAKKDGSNPELVKAVEDLLGKETPVSKTGEKIDTTAEQVDQTDTTPKSKARQKAEALRKKAQDLRDATGGAAMLAPKLVAAAYDAYATLLEKYDDAVKAFSEFKKTKEYKALGDEDRAMIDAELSEDTGQEPPTTDEKEPKFESKKRKRRFIKQVNESDKIRPEVKAAFSEDAVYYNQIPNDLTLDEANEIIDAAGLDEAKSIVLTNSKNLSPRVRVTMAQVLIKKFNEEGDIESAVEIAEDIAEVGTELGQAIQAFSMFQFLTPEGQLLRIEREAARQRAAQLAKPVHKNRVGKIVKGIKKATEEAVDETIKRMSGKIGTASTVRVQPNKRDSSYGQKNVVVKKSDYENAIKNLKGKMFSSFVPPPELITIAAYHIEAGARDFASFSKRMVEDFGEKIKDYLKPTYDAANEFLGNKERANTIADLRKKFQSLVNPPQRKTPQERKSRTDRAYEVAKELDGIFGGTEYTEIAEQFDKDTLEKQWAEAKKNFEERKADADKRNDAKERERLEQQENDAKLEAANKEYKQGQKMYDKASSESGVTQGLRELGVDIQNLIRSHYTEINKTKETLKDKLIKQIGLDPKEATELASAIERQFDALIREKRSRAIANAFPKRKQREAKSVDEKLVEASNLGLIDEAVVNQAYAEAMGFPKVTAQNAKDIKGLADRVQGAKTERDRARAVEDLLSYQEKMKGFSLFDASIGVYLSALLSGPKTQAINIIANIYNTISLYSDAVLQRPKSATYLAKGLFVGLKRGLFEGADVMRTGYAPIRGKVDIPTILERERFVGGAVNPANYAKYVRRFMLAADTVFFEGLRQMRAFQLANNIALDEGLTGKAAENKALEILGRSDESLQYAIDTANAEMEEQIDNVKTSNMTDAEKKAAIKQIKIDRRFRIHELIEKNRPSEIKEKSHQYGVEGTFNQRPTGVLGVLSDAMNDVSRKLPAVKLVVPFVNVISNVANSLIDNSPSGFIRAYKGTKGVFGKGEVMDEQERADAYAKAIKGTTIMAIAYLLTQLGDDDDEPVLEVTTNGYGDYAKNQDLLNSGWRPYSFRVKNPFTGEYTGWVSYKESPMMLVLSTIGNWSDFEKYRKADKDDTFFTKMAVSSTGAVRSMMDATFLSSGEKFLGNILDPRNESVFDDMGAWAGGAVSSMLTPGAVSQTSALIQDLMDTPDKEIRETIFGRMLKNIPVARDKYANKVNGLGEDISRQSEIVISLAEKSDSDYLWKLLIDKKATTSPPARGKEVFVTDEGVERVMTDDEFYKYSKIRGQFIKKQLKDNYAELQVLDEENFRKWLSEVKGDASLVAKTYLTTDFPKETGDYMDFIEKSVPLEYIKTFMVIPDKKNNNVFSVQAEIKERIFKLKQK